MRTTLMHAALLVLGVASLGACSSDATTAPATAPVTLATVASPNGGFRFDNTFAVSARLGLTCAADGAGELLDVTGEMRVTGHMFYSQGGQRRHSVMRGTFAGTATGRTTGDVYDATSMEHEQFNTYDGDDGIADAVESHYRGKLSFVNRATGAEIRATIVIRFVEVSPGRVVLDEWTLTEDCR